MSRFVVLGILTTGLFAALLAHGWWSAALSHRQAIGFLLVWAAGLVASPYLALGRGLVPALTACLDVVLILVIFGRDLRVR